MKSTEELTQEELKNIAGGAPRRLADDSLLMHEDGAGDSPDSSSIHR